MCVIIMTQYVLLYLWLKQIHTRAFYSYQGFVVVMEVGISPFPLDFLPNLHQHKISIISLQGSQKQPQGLNLKHFLRDHTKRSACTLLDQFFPLPNMTSCLLTLCLHQAHTFRVQFEALYNLLLRQYKLHYFGFHMMYDCL